MNEHNLKAWVYGHWHINYMKKQGDVYSVCTSSLDKGGIDHSTTAFRVMHVDSKEISLPSSVIPIWTRISVSLRLPE